MKPMTSKERFMAAMAGDSPDRPPAASIVSAVSFELMDRVGVHFPQANIEAEAMATLAAATHEILGFDSVMPIYSIAQEATALGCEVEWQSHDTMPTPTVAAWTDRTVEMALPDGFPDSFLEDRYVQCALDAIRLLKQHFGDQVMILGKVMGPWTLSYHVYNMQDFLSDTILDPDRVRRSLEILSPVPVALCQSTAGSRRRCDRVGRPCHRRRDSQYHVSGFPLTSPSGAGPTGAGPCHSPLLWKDDGSRR